MRRDSIEAKMLRYQQVFAPILGFLALWYSIVTGAFGTTLRGAQMEVVKLVRAMRPTRVWFLRSTD